MKDFNGKIAVITGGASGVGRSLAEALAREGAKVVIGDVDMDALDAVVESIKAEGHECVGARADVTSVESLTALADVAEQTFGVPQLVFANAGIGAGETGAMWDYSDKDWQWSFNVNMWGAINSIKVFMPRLVAANQEAHFAITGSGNGALMVLPDAPIYTATKAAVAAITENLHYQCVAGNLPVKVSALMPGPYVVETGLFNSGRVRPEELKKEGVEGNESGITSVEDMKKMAAEFGIELKSTHPDEVAQIALKGIKEDKYWLAQFSEETLEKMRTRHEMLMKADTPVAAMVG